MLIIILGWQKQLFPWLMLDLVQLLLQQIISSDKALMTGVLPQGQTSMLITFVFQLLNGGEDS